MANCTGGSLRDWRALRVACAVALLFALVGCDHSGVEGPDSGPSIGETIEGGTVVESRFLSEGCFSVTVELEPDWNCSAEQDALARAPVTSPSTPKPGSAPGIDEPGVVLTETDCRGLAELRRPALKQPFYAQLDATRRSQLVAHCIGPRFSFLVDADGKRISSCAATPPGTTNGRTSPAPISSPSAPQQSAPGNVPQPTAVNGSAPTGATGTPTAAPEADAGGGAEEFSTTNTQVRGVDEADFVKNDAEQVYVLSPRGLHVIDAWPAEDLREIARVAITGEPRRMFLEGDILAVYSRLTSAPTSTTAAQKPSTQGCTYGYDCRYAGEGGRTLITLFDVSNPAGPSEIHRYELSGGFVAARRVGQYVYTVVHDGGAAAPSIPLALTGVSARELEQNYVALKASIDRTIDSLPLDYFLPTLTEQTAAGGQPTRVDTCQGALASRAAGGMSFVSLAAFDLDTLAPPTRTVIAGRPGFVYSSADALYLATDGVDGVDTLPTRYTGSPDGDRSTIHKFTLDGLETRYAGSASVRGHVLNQFSMDEHEGVLRVATSSGYVPSPGVSSNVTTLAERDGSFARQGELKGLAPQEDIRSVRFDGDRGFVVTFKKTDPLFVIDLENPERPSVLGELKIPGFSTYMQRLDANHLLAVGFDADDQGSFAYFDGIQIQIFDVTELSNPRLLHKTVIGTRGSGSEALLNHLAFNYYAPKRLLALPMTICEGGDQGVFGNGLTFSGLMVFDVSLEGGIVERGRLPFVDTSVSAGQSQPATTIGSAGASCGAWWTNAASLVKRSLFMDDVAVGISDSKLKAARLSALSDVLATVSLTP
jgi:hypothetical protein